MGEIFSITNILTAGILSLTMACMYVLASQKMAGAFQQGGYSGRRFCRWYFRKDNLLKSRHILTFLLILFSSAMLGLSFSPLGVNAGFFASCVPFYLFAVLFIIADGKYALKVPYKNTGRFKRLKVVYLLITAIFNYILVTLLNVAAYYINIDLVSSVRLAPAALTVLLLPYLMLFSAALCSPFERANSHRLIKKAAKKIAASDAIKIAVTGSYGKTSVKNILSVILSEKYRVAATPESYNTPVGIAKFVNGGGLEGAQIFIAEMGARKKGDISELCRMVEPDYSVLTGVAPQHIESFKSIEEITAEKSVVLSRAKIGIVTPEIIGAEEAVKLSPAQKKMVVGKDILLSSVKETAEGTYFTIEGEGSKISSFTKLLSAHSAYNIAIAYAVAKQLGLSDDEILSGISKIDFVPHRLQKLTSGTLTVIDDAYNSNVVGARDAISVLKLFEGRKIAVTPGLVEMGILEKKENKKLGAELAEAGIDMVILVGETLVKAVKEGYDGAGGNPEKITVVPTLDAATKLLGREARDGDCILFLNDLPDVY